MAPPFGNVSGVLRTHQNTTGNLLPGRHVAQGKDVCGGHRRYKTGSRVNWTNVESCL